MAALSILIVALLSSGRFPEVVPTFRPQTGVLPGDSLAVLTNPQQLIPAYCPSITVAGSEMLVTVERDSGAFVLQGTQGGEWQALTAVGPCDTIALRLTFPGLIIRDVEAPALTAVVQASSAGVPYAFFQDLDHLSPDSCAASGIVITDPAPDSAAARHDPALVIPSSAAGLTAISVWDPTTWDSYLFTSGVGDAGFVPDSTAWSSAFPRPDTLPGGPTPLAVGPWGDITACVVAEAGDSTHIGLQPWVTRSTDRGENWDPLVLLPSAAHGSALDGQPGSMPYGSFRGGTSWYGPQVIYAGSTPLVFWTARRAPGDTMTAEERLWPRARAILCSYPTDSGWQTAYVGIPMTDSTRAYETPDWPTVVLDNGKAIVLWSDVSEDGTNLDVWACGHDVGTGSWTVPLALTSTTGSEAFLEAAGPLDPSGTYALLCADARLLYGEPVPLLISPLTLDHVWDAGTRTDVLPSPASGPRKPMPADLTLRVIPNPASGHFLLAPEGFTLLEVAIYDVAGRVRMHIREDIRLQGPVPISGLTPGAYMIVWRALHCRGTTPLVVR